MFFWLQSKQTFDNSMDKNIIKRSLYDIFTVYKMAKLKMFYSQLMLTF